MLIVYVDARLYACSAALDHVVTSPALRAAMFFFGGLRACNVYLHGATPVSCKHAHWQILS